MVESATGTPSMAARKVASVVEDSEANAPISESFSPISVCGLPFFVSSPTRRIWKLGLSRSLASDELWISTNSSNGVRVFPASRESASRIVSAADGG